MSFSLLPSLLGFDSFTSFPMSSSTILVTSSRGRLFSRSANFNFLLFGDLHLSAGEVWQCSELWIDVGLESLTTVFSCFLFLVVVFGAFIVASSCETTEKGHGHWNAKQRQLRIIFCVTNLWVLAHDRLVSISIYVEELHFWLESLQLALRAILGNVFRIKLEFCLVHLGIWR